MLRKKENYTIITPIPGFIPRQLAIDILHSHSEVITLNPLVLGHKPIKAPRDAASDEFYSTWYEIEERIQFVPGLGKMGSGKITFNGCFHDMPWGLQTHIYAPMNIDLRTKYKIDGNQPGYEPPQPLEMGMAALGAPPDGLYLREDIEIRCNVTMVSFVKAETKRASKEMVQRIIKKAELLDSGALQAMIENGRLKTINPADRSSTGAANAGTGPLRSPTFPHNSMPYQSPKLEYQRPLSPQTQVPYQIPRPISVQPHRPGTAGSQGHPSPQYGEVAELASNSHYAPAAGSSSMPVEMPAEVPAAYHQPQPSPQMQPPHPSPGAGQGFDRDSMSQQSRQSADPNSNWRYSQGQGSPSMQSSRPTSISSDTGSGGYGSPGLDHKGFSSELATHRETREEHAGADRKFDEATAHRVTGPHGYQNYAYNPQDYAKMSR